MADPKDDRQPNTILMPTEAVVRERADQYVAALGRVAHSWNYLQERLGQLFTKVAPTAPHNIMLAVWYSQQNDRNQRRMLRAAINAGAMSIYKDTIPTTAADDILWLLKEADELSGRRDQAIHAPACLTTDVNGTQMSAAYYFGNHIAYNLKDKNLIDEFDVSEWRADQLSKYIIQIVNTLDRGTQSWPQKRPSLSRELRRQQLESSPQQPKK